MWLRPNSRWEGWLDETGAVIAGDLDEGEHADFAIAQMMRVGPFFDHLIRVGALTVREASYMRDWDIPRLFEYLDSDFESFPERVCARAAGGKEKWEEIRHLGVRVAYMKRVGAIRVMNNEFEVYTLDRATLGAIFQYVFPRSLALSSVCIEQHAPEHRYGCLGIRDFVGYVTSPHNFWRDARAPVRG